MSKKSTPLLLRPEPPRVEDIVDDIENADDNDVIFSTLVNKTNGEVPQSPMDQSGLFSCDEASPNPRHGQANDASIEQDSPQPNVEIMYKQAVRFIELTEALKKGPGRLKEQCDYLQACGQDLQQSIDRLKEQAQTALNSSRSEG